MFTFEFLITLLSLLTYIIPSLAATTVTATTSITKATTAIKSTLQTKITTGAITTAKTSATGTLPKGLTGTSTTRNPTASALTKGVKTAAKASKGLPIGAIIVIVVVVVNLILVGVGFFCYMKKQKEKKEKEAQNNTGGLGCQGH